MLRPRHEFPTPLFRLTVQILIAATLAVIVLVAYLAMA